MHESEALEAHFVANLRERVLALRPVIDQALDVLAAQREPCLVLLAEADPRALMAARRLPWPEPPRAVARYARILVLRTFLTGATTDGTLDGIGAWALTVVDEVEAMEDAQLSAGFEMEWRQAVAWLVDAADLVPIAAHELAQLVAIERGLRARQRRGPGRPAQRPPPLRRRRGPDPMTSMAPVLAVKTLAAVAPASDAGAFTARVSVFDMVDRAGDRIRPGAFAESLATWRRSTKSIPVVWSHAHHDVKAMLGKVLDAREDAQGLVVDGQLELTYPEAARAHALLKSGTVSDWSFAFLVMGGAAADVGGRAVRDITKAHVLEVGPCLIGMNPETRDARLEGRRRSRLPARGRSPRGAVPPPRHLLGARGRKDGAAMSTIIETIHDEIAEGTVRMRALLDAAETRTLTGDEAKEFDALDASLRRLSATARRGRAAAICSTWSAWRRGALRSRARAGRRPAAPHARRRAGRVRRLPGDAGRGADLASAPRNA